MASAFEGGCDGSRLGAEGDHAAAFRARPRPTPPTAVKVAVHGDDRARPQPAAGTDEGFPAVVAEVAQEEHLRRSAALAPAEQARGKDAAAVDDEEVARAQQARQVAEDVVGGRLRRRGAGA